MVQNNFEKYQNISSVMRNKRNLDILFRDFFNYAENIEF